ncbi:serine-enriched protein [Gigaspora margarita]|uniref:Serine-enriched protein n=1 Tax=Gigaspora margarita TaxID=4874 RepID=A0A8H3XLP3_GIGMA|nr:serine-enriched protein [Gigaspora margarita]
MSEPQQSQFIESESQSTQSDITQLQDDLCRDISQLFEDADDYNVIIQVGSGSDFGEFKAHSVILRARCPYFKTALSDKWVEKIENIYYFSKPNISPAVFSLILRYIYTGALDLTDQSGYNALALLIASDELLIEQIVKHVQVHFIRKKSNWLKKNLPMVLSTISKLQSCKMMQDYIMTTIDLPIGSESTIHVLLVIADKLALIQLIDRIQKLLIKNEPSWLKKDLIGFLCKIFNDNKYKKIKYYIMDTIFRDVILRPRNGLISIDSSIIKGKHARIIIRWIEGINALTEKSFAEFTCIYRATDCKFEYQKFIKVLDSISSTSSSSKVLFIKVKNSDKIIGGYIGSHNFRDIFLPKERRNKDFILCLGSEKDSNFHICCNVRCPHTQRFIINEPWINFYSEGAHLKLYGQKGTCSVLNDRNFIAEEIEIFCINR